VTDSKYFCDLSALNDEERARYREFEKLLPPLAKGISEQDNGYTLSFPMTPGNFVLIAEFVTYESRCCPFLSFSLSAISGEEDGSLAITSAPDAKSFIAAELGLLH
jgi:hypothetical protein